MLSLLLRVCFLFFLLGSAGLTIGMTIISRNLPNPNALLERHVEQSTKIFDRTGKHLLYEIHGNQNRTLVALDQIPDALIQATIAVEDQQFFKHTGFNPVRIFKGIVLGFLRSGRPQGGSTITQQLVKNVILSNERTVSRKLKELLLSIAIEQRLTKPEILQLYLNEIPYGSTNYGVEAAARSYFGKSVQNLTIGEAATLAALPKAPTTFLNNPDLLADRREIILFLMVQEGFLTQEEAELAKQESVTLLNTSSGLIAPHFIFYVKELLIQQHHFSERDVEEGGFTVFTTLDYDKQLMAEQAVREGVEARKEAFGFENAALVALDSKTGEILSMVGSKDYFDTDIDGAVNVALRPRQPGSSFKPIIYALGFEKGFTPNSILEDVVTLFPAEPKDYEPHNYDLKERGPVSIRQALQGSLNIPAVQMLSLVGVDDALALAERLGYSTFDDRSRFGLSVVLGGGEVKLLEHVNAYATFGRDGLFLPTPAISKILSPTNETLFEFKAGQGKRVLEEKASRLLSDVLSDDPSRQFVFGSQNFLTLPGRPVAAKTGTTNDYRDAWTVGYTPSLAAGVWVGNNDNEAMTKGADGSKIAAPIWQAFMQKALEGTPKEEFSSVEIPLTGKPILDGALPAASFTLDRASKKLATEFTPASFQEEHACGEFHSILHYVDPENPLGDPPAYPESNQQYDAWESALRSWVERVLASDPGLLPFEPCAPPTEKDDLHIPAHQPSLEILSPTDGASVSRDFTVSVNARAPRGIARLEYFLDGKFIEWTPSVSGSVLAVPSWAEPGFHRLSITAFDDIDNATLKNVSVNVLGDAPSPFLRFLGPLNGQTIEKTTEAFPVAMEISDPSAFDQVTLRLTSLQKKNSQVLESKEQPSEVLWIFPWTLPEEGEYVLRVEARLRDQSLRTSDPLFIKIRDAAPETSLNLLPSIIPDRAGA